MITPICSARRVGTATQVHTKAVMLLWEAHKDLVACDYKECDQKLLRVRKLIKQPFADEPL